MLGVSGRGEQGRGCDSPRDSWHWSLGRYRPRVATAAALPAQEPPSPRSLVHGARPLAQRTADRIVADLVAGGARTGDRLPSERVLSATYRVSRVTVRAALADLEQRHLVSPSPSRGWFLQVAPGWEGPAPGDGHPHALSAVAAGPLADAGGHGRVAAARSARADVQGFADFARSRGLVARARVLEQRVRPATVEEAAALRTAPGVPLFELRRLRSLEGLVVVWEHNLLPLSVCPALPDVDFATGGLYATLRSADPPVHPRVADYSVEARTATDAERELLQIDGPVPLLVARQLSYDQRGRPVELTTAAYRGDRYRFTASITSG